jgi:hypothetical protein
VGLTKIADNISHEIRRVSHPVARAYRGLRDSRPYDRLDQAESIAKFGVALIQTGLSIPSAGLNGLRESLPQPRTAFGKAARRGLDAAVAIVSVPPMAFGLARVAVSALTDRGPKAA